MDLKRTSAFAGAAVCAISLGVTSLASAKVSTRTFANTFPFANKLCTETKAGLGNAHRKADAAAIIADCTTLEMKYQELTKAASTGQAAVRTAIANDKASFQTACPKPPTASTPAVRVAACRTAKHNEQVTFRHIAVQRFEVINNFVKGLQSARLTFWTAIHALPGASSIKPDVPIPSPTPPKH
jgi:hypothetical protein